MAIQINSHRHQNERNLFAMRVVAFAALIAVSIAEPTQARADEGRIHLTFFKAQSGSGSGYLFFRGQKFGLSVSGAKIRRVWITAIDLIGTASNLRSAGDIVGAYMGGDAEAAIVKHAKAARLENTKGIVLEIRAVNLNRWFSLDLSGMTIKNAGWQPSPDTD